MYTQQNGIIENIKEIFSGIKEAIQKKAQEKNWHLRAIALNIICLFAILLQGKFSGTDTLPFLLSPLSQLRIEEQHKKTREVFGFAPYWTMNKLDNVNFDSLTTLAYFGVEIDGDGNVVQDDPGYQAFKSRRATKLFQKAHAHGTRVVLTLTQMQHDEILRLMDNPSGQQNAITQVVDLVKRRGIDGINVDFEYGTDAGEDYRNKFTVFINNITRAMHQEIPGSYVTVSVYASAVKDPKIYDIAKVSQAVDGIFMMAYDFAVAGSDNAIPTAPLYGHKNGKYWYDVSTAVADFLTQMPANKLILGVPYYGYDYVVYSPEEKAETRPYYSWRGTPSIQTYANAMESVKADKAGWDTAGQVGWKAYYVSETDTWRMIYLEDAKSLGIKFDFAKEKSLAGIGMWALGFDTGRSELWDLIEQKFGLKLANNAVLSKVIGENI